MKKISQNIKFKNLLLFTAAAVSLNLSSFSAQAMLDESVLTAVKNVRKDFKEESSVARRIAEDELSNAIQEVSEHQADFRFVPVTYRNNEKSF